MMSGIVRNFKKNQWFNWFLVCLIGLSVVACGDKKKSPKVKKSKYFTHGDPMQIIEGATLSTDLDVDWLKLEGKEYFYNSIIVFSEKTEIKDKEDDGLFSNSYGDGWGSFTLKAENKEKGTFKLFGESNFFQIKGDGSKKVFDVVLKQHRGEKIEKEISESYEILHLSVSKNYESISVLFLIPASIGKAKMLACIEFRESYDSENFFNTFTIDTLKKYFYSSGEGVAVKWDQNEVLDINFCSKDKEELKRWKDPIAKGVQVWQNVLIDRLEVNLSFVDKYPPFSDLNFHCFYATQEFFSKKDINSVNNGVAFTFRNPNNGLFFSSDVFLFEKETEKYFSLAKQTYAKEWKDSRFKNKFIENANESIKQDRYITVAHEFGHVLGLDHPFEYEKGKDTDSIMNYEKDDYALTPYDIEAIQALYPVIP